MTDKIIFISFIFYPKTFEEISEIIRQEHPMNLLRPNNFIRKLLKQNMGLG